ncbi:von Willebrand factor type A domain protein [Onchocerca flexuosa]|uniref:von Willebrand factor type A domain protein n=1 Tax=Onchocerca flexuosa TaxID=387005 RepID=A0A238BZ23_9BILA|nr:von Willebrand factor type A domain protein [Onchocerca flexuosa]
MISLKLRETIEIYAINLLCCPKFDTNKEKKQWSIIEYSSPLRRRVKLPFTAHKNRRKIIEAIQKLPFFAGVTATGAALQLALEVLHSRRSNVLTNVVVLTDGFSYDYVEQPSMMLHRLPNVQTFTATVTETWRQLYLKKGKD